MSHDIPEDALDPIKIRADIAPRSQAKLSQQKGPRLRWALIVSSAITLVCLSIPFFSPLDLRAKAPLLNSDEVMIFTDPPGAELSTDSLNNQGNRLGLSGTPLAVEKIFEGQVYPDSAVLFITKDGYSAVQQTLTRMDLGAGMWPQKHQPILRLQTSNPIVFLTDYLPRYRPVVFGGLCLGFFSSLIWGVLLWRHSRQLAIQEAVRQRIKTEDPVSGLSLLGYEVLERRGRGATSLIYKGVLEKDWVTMRALRFTRFTEIDEKILQERRREIGVHQKLDHPNIIKFYEAQAFAKTFVMVMELIEGGDLKAFLSKKAPLSPAVAIPIFEKIANALDYAHSTGVTHRDLKPANVMMRTDGTPVIIDFGMAADVSAAKITQTGVVKGTIAYISPEQLTGIANRVGPKSDQFAFGIMLFEALSNHSPYNTEKALMEVVSERFNPACVISFETFVPRAPQEITDVIMKMIAYDPEERYPTISDGMNALKEAFRISRWHISTKLVLK